MAACASRKSATEAARTASRGNLAASSRNCCRNQLAVSSRDAASSSSPGFNTAPGPSMRSSQPRGSARAPKPSSWAARNHSQASQISTKPDSSTQRFVPGSSASTARRPGAHVVRSRSNSRSLSNSRTSCAVRAIVISIVVTFAGLRLGLYKIEELFYWRWSWRCCAASPAESATYTSRPFASPQDPG